MTASCHTQASPCLAPGAHTSELGLWAAWHRVSRYLGTSRCCTWYGLQEEEVGSAAGRQMCVTDTSWRLGIAWSEPRLPNLGINHREDPGSAQHWRTSNHTISVSYSSAHPPIAANPLESSTTSTAQCAKSTTSSARRAGADGKRTESWLVARASIRRCAVQRIWSCTWARRGGQRRGSVRNVERRGRFWKTLEETD